MSHSWAARPPHPVLRGLVTRYVGYAQENVTLEVHRGLPSRHLTLVISLEKPIRYAGLAGPGELQSVVGGLHTEPALITQDRVQRGVQLELDPLGARTLLGVTAAELTGRVTDLADFGGDLARLPDRLAEAEDWRARFAIVDQVLAARAVEPADTPPELDRAWHELRRSGGQLRVGELADEVGWSRRHLGERFRAELGLAPKQAARVLRFERAVRLLRAGHRDLAGIAYAAGYYDQAHFSNEWRALAGCSPRTWMAEELPFLQDETKSAAAESGA
ncbi:helix-turn-helix domain-containing protein [Amycolatopsis echigonensis]|uniref:AraC-like DNA-binding protein n=1 Tax=Amycolatopsis echigonensis TaxID=2576905 RepID=A0A2N3WAQ0_9PSEU|nr:MULTISPECIES: AraC family transcriptional regulator [Amycolatopsis]MBB2503674.1 helix-turn-helix transcriptional regulator [Amycolatopsis echigonensis]PKV90957.1 AraC-like DNA-binding protein [Amycolatopsis niigatensis]